MRIHIELKNWVITVQFKHRYQAGAWIGRRCLAHPNCETGIAMIPGAWRHGLRAMFCRHWSTETCD